MARQLWIIGICMAFLMPSLASAQTVPVDKKCVPQWRKKLPVSDTNVRKEPLLDLVKKIAKWTCYNFIVGSDVRGRRLTILTRQTVTVRQYYQAFLSALEVNSITVLRKGRFKKLTPSRYASRNNNRTYLSGRFRGSSKDEMVTYLLRVKYIDVYKLSSILRQLTPSNGKIVNFPSQGVILLVQYASNLSRLLRIVQALDVPESETKDHMYLVQIENGQAADIVARVRSVFQIMTRDRRRRLRRTGTISEEHILSKILADERTNRVIIVSSHKSYLNALSLIKKLDVPLEGEGKIRVHYLRYAKAEEIAQTLSQLAQGARRTVRRRKKTKKVAAAAQSTDLFGGEVRITADKATNALVIVSNKRDYDSLMKVIRQLDVRRKQVFVETVILEVSLDKTRDLGLAFHGGAPLDGNLKNATSGDSPGYALFGTRLAGLNSLLFDPTTLTGLALGLAGPEIPGSSALLGGTKNVPAFGVLMRAIQTNNDVDIISTPHLLTATNQQASIEVGQNVPFIAGTSFSAAGVGLSFPVRNIQRQDVSLKMQIKPQINAGDRVKLEVDLELSEIASQNAELGPTTTKRKIKTVIRVRDKQTIVLGGLMRKKTTLGESKVPILGDIPVLGALFRFRNRGSEKRNLLIFLTPHIIYKPQDFQKIFLQKLRERQEFLRIFYAGRKGSLPKHIAKRVKLKTPPVIINNGNKKTPAPQPKKK